MRIKQLLTIIFLSSFLCTSVFAEGSKFDRGANSDEVTAQTRDDIWLSPSSIPYITTTSYETIWVPAISMTPRQTNGPSVGTYEYPTNDVNKDYLAFDATTEQFAEFEFPMPEDWDRGTIKVKFPWTSATGSTAGDTVEWQLAGQASSDGDAIDIAYGDAGEVISDVLLANNGTDRQMSSATPAVTIGGSPALGDIVHYVVSRNVGGSDNMTEKARLNGAWIQYKTGEPVVAW